ncbi:MAG: MFS transporter [Bacillota bacterium]
MQSRPLTRGSRLPSMISQFPRNAVTLLLTEPFWSVPANWFNTYFCLYMRASGLSPVKIGWITAFGIIGRLAFSLFGGHLADNWGRKITLVVFDILSWSVPLAIWAFATEFWHFALCAVLNSLVWIAVPAWFCLFMEEAREDQRTKIYAINHSIYFIAGLTLPLAGLIIKKAGFLPGMRLIIWIFFGSVALMILLRASFLRESHIGRKIKQENAFRPTEQSAANYGSSWCFLWRAKNLRTLLLLGIGYSFIASMAGTYYALFVTEKAGLNLSRDYLVFFALLTSVITGTLSMFLVPKIPFHTEKKFLLFSQLLNLAGYALFVMTPAGILLWIWPAIIFWAVSNGLYVPIREGLWHNEMPNEERAKIISLAGVLECLIILPAAPLGGWIYQINPRLLYLAGAAVVAGIIMLITAYNQRERI